MPGTGKTHFGRLMAKSLHLQFFDLDEQIEKREGALVRQVILEKGESYFRQVEHEVLLQLSTNNHCVLSCGGGAPMFFNNIDVMKSTGIVVWINTDLTLIAKRIHQNITRRPLFMGLNELEILQKLHDIYELRKKNYAKADLVSEINVGHDNSLISVIQGIMKINRRRKK
jgi:shikimate kinase